MGFACSDCLVRMLPPHVSELFARAHDAAILATFSSLLHVLCFAQAQLPLGFGGLGVRSAVLLRDAAYWASWVDCLSVLRVHVPTTASALIRHIQNPACVADSFRAWRLAFEALQATGFQPPDWHALDHQSAPSPAANVSDYGLRLRGWQQPAAHSVSEAAHAALVPILSLSAQALLASQQGPFASRILTLLPTAPELTFASDQFRGLLLRRLRLPFPLSEQVCRCCRTLDPLGDHRSACSRPGVLRARASALERAAARICRDAGARVVMNVRIADLNMSVARVDDRRLEVVANGLSCFGGVQLAVNTTLVSLLDSQGRPHRRTGQFAGAAARLRKERAYPEFGATSRCKLVVLGVEGGGRWSCESADFVRALAHHNSRSIPALLRSAACSAFVARWSSL